MRGTPRFPESAGLDECWQLAPTESRITLEPKRKALRVITPSSLKELSGKMVRSTLLQFRMLVTRRAFFFGSRVIRDSVWASCQDSPSPALSGNREAPFMANSYLSS